mgnify:CR=1 FL=1
MHVRRNDTLFRIVAVAGLAIASLAGCTRGTQGIFATIEVEEKTDTSNLVDNTTVSALVRTAIGGSDRYVVLAGTKVFTRETASSSWSEVGGPSGLAAVQLAGINSDSSADTVVEEVYAVFFDSAAAEYHLYSLQASGTGVAWNEVADTSVWQASDGYQVTGLVGAGDRMFMSVSRNPDASDAADKQRELWSIAAGPAVPVVLGGFSDSLRDAAYDGTNLVVVGRGTLIARTTDITAASSLTDISASVTNAKGVGAFPSGLSGTGNDAFAIVTLDGTVSVSTDGGSTWTEADGSLSDRSLSDIAWVAHRGMFVVGTRSETDFGTTRRGYYEATATAGSPYSFSFTNDIGDSYSGSELAVSAITFFEYFSDNTLFALTNGKGLWRTVYPTTGTTTWQWE